MIYSIPHPTPSESQLLGSQNHLPSYERPCNLRWSNKGRPRCNSKKFKQAKLARAMCNVMAYQAGPDCSLPSQMTVPNKVEICRLKISKILKLLNKHNFHTLHNGGAVHSFLCLQFSNGYYSLKNSRSTTKNWKQSKQQAHSTVLICQIS